MTLPGRPGPMIAVVFFCLMAAVSISAHASGEGAGVGVLSLKGFGGLTFGAELSRIRARFPRAEVEFDRGTGQGMVLVRHRASILGRFFEVRLNLSRGRLYEVVYTPVTVCRGTCLTAIRSFVAARVGSRPEALPAVAPDQPATWLWTADWGKKSGRLTSVTVNYKSGRLVDIYVTDQSDQQVLRADAPGPDAGPANGG